MAAKLRLYLALEAAARQRLGVEGDSSHRYDPSHAVEPHQPAPIRLVDGQFKTLTLVTSRS